MKDAKVIEFPKAQSVRKRLQDKAQEQKAILILSIASVLIMTVFLNQWLVQAPESSLTAAGARGVASFEPAAFARDVKWEHDLAKRLANENSSLMSSLGESPTLRDDLIFGFLQGKYGMKLSQGRIESLEFIDAQAGEQPLAIENKGQFLRKYSEAFGLDFKEASPAQIPEESPSSTTTGGEKAEEVYSLIDTEKEIIGQAHFNLDESGRVQSIVFTR